MSGALLITGGAGYIGSHIAHAVRDVEPERKIVIVDDLSNGHRKLLPEGIIFHQCDIADEESIPDILYRENIEAVIHCAGSVEPGESVERPAFYYENNSLKTKKLWEFCKAAPSVERFVFSSTAAVYAAPSGKVIAREDSPLDPPNPYGRSKLMAEWLLQDCPNEPTRVGILRYFNVAGGDPLGRAGLMSKRSVHLIKRCAMVAVGSLDEVVIHGDDYETPDGTGIRDYIHVSDLASAHLTMLNAMRGERRFHLANCGYGSGYSVREILNAFEEVAGRPLPHRTGPRRPGDAACVIADVTRINGMGFTPRYNDIRLIIKHAIEWERKMHGQIS